MELTGDQYQQLSAALLDAFPRKIDLEQMVQHGLNENLEAIVGGNSNNEIVHNLIKWVKARDRISDLVTAALEANPYNGSLNTFAAHADISKLSVVAPPQPTGSMLPELRLWIDIQQTSYTWLKSNPVQIAEVILYIKNVGKEMVLGLTPHVKVQDEQGEVTVDVAAQVQKANIVYELSPEWAKSIPIFGMLAGTGNIIDAIQMFGLDYLLERKFTLEAYCTYKAPNRRRKTETQTLVFIWSWHQPDILQDKIEIKWYGETLFRPKNRAVKS